MINEMRKQYTMAPSQMFKWKEICSAFAEKLHAKLLFVNETSCGLQHEDGTFSHVSVEDMMEYLKNNK